MVGTVLPIVYGERKLGQLSTVLGLHALGYIAGACCLGVLLGALGAIFSDDAGVATGNSTVLVVTGFASLIYSTRELGLVPVPVLQFRRQVPHKWRFLPPKVMALFYGVGLGFGLATRIPVSTFYIAIIWVVLTGSLKLGVLSMAAFGLGRALPLVFISGRLGSVAGYHRLARTLYGWEPLVHLINGLALGFAGSGLLVASLASR